MQLSELVYYPVKSMRGIALESTEAGIMGLSHDREWLLTDEAGQFITARAYPQLLLWQARCVDEGLQLIAPDGDSRTVAVGDLARSSEVTVWKVPLRRIPVVKRVTAGSAKNWLRRW